MSFTRRFFGARRPRWDWRQYSTPEAFATALCLARVETEEARGLLRRAIDESEAEVNELSVAAQERQRAAEVERRRREGAHAAALKLLADVGFRSEEVSW